MAIFNITNKRLLDEDLNEIIDFRTDNIDIYISTVNIKISELQINTRDI